MQRVSTRSIHDAVRKTHTVPAIPASFSRRTPALHDPCTYTGRWVASQMREGIRFLIAQQDSSPIYRRSCPERTTSPNTFHTFGGDDGAAQYGQGVCREFRLDLSDAVRKTFHDPACTRQAFSRRLPSNPCHVHWTMRLHPNARGNALIANAGFSPIYRRSCPDRTTSP